ncbi:MAG: hypothetical protein FVQ82_08815 [Planctomycetes bacterium]|nr:hypothetical protein [Planctomycetota bacterium]
MKNYKLTTLIVCIAALQQFAYAEQPANAVTAAPVIKPAPVAKPPAAVKVTTKASDFAGYDFEQVVLKVETSVNPLQKAMAGSLKVFAESVDQAQKLIEQGKSKEAIQKCSIAMETVLKSRDKVLKPMWAGQDYLNDQIGKVRARLAIAVEAAGGDSKVKLDKKTEKLLDGIASRISREADPLRKKRLVAHYRTIRQLSKIKQMAKQLSPNQRKLWRNVLGVLENTALTHQQVLMGTEVLFAQFEATTTNLKEYEGLIDTVEGASRLLGVVKGLGESGQGLAQFSRNMTQLQKRMAGFNTQLEGILEDKMIDLEAQSEAISSSIEIDGAGSVMGSAADDELNARLKKFETKKKP